MERLVKKKTLTGLFCQCIMCKVMHMEEFVKQSLLYDFYGELLTEHQQRIYTSVIFEDYSVSEVAREEGISRQGVHDMVRRCNKALEEYEARLHLVERFVKIRGMIENIQALTDPGLELSVEERLQRIRCKSGEILEEL